MTLQTTEISRGWVRMYFTRAGSVGEKVKLRREVGIGELKTLFKQVKPELERKLRELSEKKGIITILKR